jgi:hypothetical protein
MQKQVTKNTKENVGQAILHGTAKLSSLKTPTHPPVGEKFDAFKTST